MEGFCFSLCLVVDGCTLKKLNDRTALTLYHSWVLVDNAIKNSSDKLGTHSKRHNQRHKLIKHIILLKSKVSYKVW
ncbi:hypothetical protein K445DRAFT_313173 [Daldinia sp. EC12]|nr:hypothetical protein K445DRAFT_313173 [Daldinia sp. EC12]